MVLMGKKIQKQQQQSIYKPPEGFRFSSFDPLCHFLRLHPPFFRLKEPAFFH